LRQLSIGKRLHPVQRWQCFQYQAVILGGGASRSRASSSSPSRCCSASG
jgi:hypothetical protein